MRGRKWERKKKEEKGRKRNREQKIKSRAQPSPPPSPTTNHRDSAKKGEKIERKETEKEGKNK